MPNNLDLDIAPYRQLMVASLRTAFDSLFLCPHLRVSITQAHGSDKLTREIELQEPINYVRARQWFLSPVMGHPLSLPVICDFTEYRQDAILERAEWLIEQRAKMVKEVYMKAVRCKIDTEKHRQAIAKRAAVVREKYGEPGDITVVVTTGKPHQASFKATLRRKFNAHFDVDYSINAGKRGMRF